MPEVELRPLLRAATLHPEEIRTKAKSLRLQSRQCADLADTSVTAIGKQILSDRAEEFRREADQLEHAIVTIRRLYGESISNDKASRIEN